MQCPPQDAEAVSQCVQKAVMARLAWIQLASEPEPEPEPPQAAAPAPADEAAEFHTPRPEAAEEGVPPEGVTAEDDVYTNVAPRFAPQDSALVLNTAQITLQLLLQSTTAIVI